MLDTFLRKEDERHVTIAARFCHRLLLRLPLNCRDINIADATLERPGGFAVHSCFRHHSRKLELEVSFVHCRHVFNGRVFVVAVEVILIMETRCCIFHLRV